MPSNARIGDYVSISCPHGGVGVIVSGSPDRSSLDSSQARVGDTVICIVCGQSGSITSGSPNAFVNGLPVARVGDSTSGICNLGIPDCCPHGRSGTIISGAHNVSTN